jgi:hypothetical protein
MKDCYKIEHVPVTNIQKNPDISRLFLVLHEIL